jgi:hypothetical protein
MSAQNAQILRKHIHAVNIVVLLQPPIAGWKHFLPGLTVSLLPRVIRITRMNAKYTSVMESMSDVFLLLNQIRNRVRPTHMIAPTTFVMAVGCASIRQWQQEAFVVRPVIFAMPKKSAMVRLGIVRPMRSKTKAVFAARQLGYAMSGTYVTE